MSKNTPFVKVETDPVTGEIKQIPVASPDELPPEVRRSFIEARDKLEAEQRAKAIENAKTIKQNIAPKRDFKDLSKEEQDMYAKDLDEMAKKLGVQKEELPANIPDQSDLVEKLNSPVQIKEEIKSCPCCGWDITKDPVEITEEDKANWLRSVIGSEAFHKTFKLYGGKLSVTFRSRTMDDNNLVSEQLVLDSQNNKFLSDVPVVSAGLHQGRARRLSMACSFVQLSPNSFKAPPLNSQEALKLYSDKVGKQANLVGSAHDVLFGKWPETLYSAVFSQYLKFESVCHRLMESSISSDFWEGVEFST